MEKIAAPSKIKAYFLLIKPGILAANLLTAFAGFMLASLRINSRIDLPLLAFTLSGLFLIMAGGCVWNNYIDKEIDKKMKRTEARALARGTISPVSALFYGGGLNIAGVLLLAFYSSYLALYTAVFGLFFYVIVYSLIKYKSIHATLLGSIAGAVPPVVGYVAVSHRFDLASLLLFLLLIFWQMPHFFAIAIYRIEDYKKTFIPLLPIVKGIRVAKVQMLLYAFGFACISSLLTVLGYTGYCFLFVTLLSSLYWISLCIKGFWCDSDGVWARKMFLFSLVVITLTSTTLFL